MQEHIAGIRWSGFQRISIRTNLRFHGNPGSLAADSGPLAGSSQIIATRLPHHRRPFVYGSCVLAVLRHDQRVADLAGGNDVSATTIRRWTDEVIALLAAKAPRLDRALKKITREGGEVVLVDGTLIRTRRRSGKANRKNYSGKHKSHGLLFLALTDERGSLIWISSARRGAASEIKTARHDKLCEHLRTADLGALADLGFVGLNDDPDDAVIITGVKRTRKKKLTTGQKLANQIIAAARAPVEPKTPAHHRHERPRTQPHQPSEQPIQVGATSVAEFQRYYKVGGQPGADPASIAWIRGVTDRWNPEPLSEPT